MKHKTTKTNDKERKEKIKKRVIKYDYTQIWTR